jgi:hypothetical protein
MTVVKLTVDAEETEALAHRDAEGEAAHGDLGLGGGAARGVDLAQRLQPHDVLVRTPALDAPRLLHDVVVLVVCSVDDAGILVDVDREGGEVEHGVGDDGEQEVDRRADVEESTS